ncbi:DUF3238 domain-containing protein [Paenibacillus sp. NPDC058177]|uniref:DUF3238 domain-containing protein n=1 Tax=Paenibacillus sp. NPDC058177 TaxID=3346369 RepID=UPI0036DBB80C
MKKHFKLVLTFLFTLIFLSPTSVYAERQMPLEIKTFNQSIELTVNNHNSKFTVTDLDRDNKVLYEGSDQTIELNNLEPNSLYRFKVSLLNDSGLEQEAYYFSTQTKSDDTQNLRTTENFKLSVDAIVSSDQVILSWERFPNIEKYEVYKDNKLVAEVEESLFVDKTETVTPYSTYEIRFEIPLSPNEKQELKSYYKAIGKSLTEDELNNIAKKPYSIIKVVDASIVNPTLQLAAINNSFKWTYKTFIPMDYAEDPWYNAATWGQNIKFFKGDNRGFSSTAETYRTKTVGDSVFYTDSTVATEDFFKNVSSTNAYDANKNFVSSKTDSGAYINRLVNNISSSKVDVTVYHKSGNPYAVQGNEIDYQMRVVTQKGGAYSFDGVHDRAPSHELYVRLSNGTTLTIFNHAHEGFQYLGAPSTLARTFNVSN